MGCHAQHISLDLLKFCNPRQQLFPFLLSLFVIGDILSHPDDFSRFACIIIGKHAFAAAQPDMRFVRGADTVVKADWPLSLSREKLLPALVEHYVIIRMN